MTPIVPPDATAATLSAEAVGKCMSNKVVHLHITRGHALLQLALMYNIRLNAKTKINSCTLARALVLLHCNIWSIQGMKESKTATLQYCYPAEMDYSTSRWPHLMMVIHAYHYGA